MKRKLIPERPDPQEEILNSQGTTVSEQQNLMQVAKEELRKRTAGGSNLLTRELNENGLVLNSNSDDGDASDSGEEALKED